MKNQEIIIKNRQQVCIMTNPQNQIQKSSKVYHSLGSIKINRLLYFFIPLLILACLYSYHEAVKKKQEPPFPHATITSTACHYSQDIVFRFLMLPAGSFLCLVYFIAYKWLKYLKKKSGYEGPIFGYLYYWAQASILGFYGAIATIDQKGTPPIHGIGAVFFFILLYIISTSITIVLADMHAWDTRIISAKSIKLKAGLAIYLFIVALYFIIGSILENREQQNGEDIYLVTIQWNLTIGCLIWLLTFTFDLGDIHITFKGDFTKTVKKLI